MLLELDLYIFCSQWALDIICMQEMCFLFAHKWDFECKGAEKLLAERGCEKPCRSMPDGRIIKSNRLPCVGDIFIGVALMVCLKKKSCGTKEGSDQDLCFAIFAIFLWTIDTVLQYTSPSHTRAMIHRKVFSWVSSQTSNMYYQTRKQTHTFSFSGLPVCPHAKTFESMFGLSE